MGNAIKSNSKRKRIVRQIDVAQEAGVSRACVSIALSSGKLASKSRIPEETAERIRRVAQKMGYRPNPAAQQLAGSRSRVIGLLIDGDCDAMPTSRMIKIIFAMQKQAYARGYRLLLANTYDDEQVRDYVEDFRARQIEGVLCMHLSERTTCESLVSTLSGMSKVVFYRKPEGNRKHGYVQVDYAHGIELAVAHLAEQGRKKIGLAVYSDKPIPMTKRIEGYRSGLAKAGKRPDEKLLWVGNGIGVPEPAMIDDVIENLVVKNKADAVIASNDEWAIALIKRLGARGIGVPHDVAVIGFDNAEEAATALSPELTSIDHDDEAIGRSMVDAVLAEEEGGARSRVVDIKPFLVVRESA